MRYKKIIINFVPEKRNLSPCRGKRNTGAAIVDTRPTVMKAAVCFVRRFYPSVVPTAIPYNIL
jgi:hypothetical protein